jgi:chromosome segregation ATPase
LERLKGAVESYARDVRELEGLVERLEGDLVATEGVVADKTEIETRLAARTAALEAQIEELEATHAQVLEDLRRSHKAEMEGRNREAGRALALRDARVTELRTEIERVDESLRVAHETVRKLRIENAQVKSVNEVLKKENEGLTGDVEEERKKAKEVVDTMRAELERVVKKSEGLLDTPRKVGKKASRRDSALGEEGQGEEVSMVTPSSSRRSSLGSEDTAKRGHGRKRRRYDSGLGFLDEEEVDA